MLKLALNHGRILALMVLVCAVSVRSVSAVSTIAGFVRDINGNPIVGVDLDIIDIATGVKLVTLNDNTDVNGFYSITVLNSIFYHITFAPPPGTNFMGKRFKDFDLTTSKALDVVLENGIVISGTIRDEIGNPVGDVDVDADNFISGRIFTPDDNSDLITGAYWVVVPAGRYRFRYDPPPEGNLRGLQIETVDVIVDTVIDVTLLDGFVLSGSITDDGGIPIENVDVGLRTIPDGKKLFISKNSSDSLGSYYVVLPSGLFELRFEPARGSKFLGVRIDSFNISGNMILNQTLSSGLLLTVNVTNALGAAVVRADIDVNQQSSGQKMFTPNDKTDAFGVAQVVVTPDIYSIQVDPPFGSVFDQVVVKNLEINNDTTISVILLEVNRVNVSGSVESSSGIGLGEVEIDLLPVATGISSYLVNNITDSTGMYSFAAPVGLHDVLYSPPVGSRLVALQIDDVTLNVDTLWNTVVLDSGIQILITLNDLSGNPIAGGDVDIIDEFSSRKVFTPHDNSNSVGLATVVVNSGLYTIVATPPAGALLGRAILNSVNIMNDTSFTMVLTSFDTPEPGLNFVLGQNYPNPFSDITNIPYIVLSPSNVSLSIYNILGQEVNVLTNRSHLADQYLLSWDGTGRRGQALANGIYFYRLMTPQGAQTLKISLVR